MLKKSPYKITSEHLEKNNEDGKLIEFPLLVTKFLGKTIPAAGRILFKNTSIKNYKKCN